MTTKEWTVEEGDYGDEYWFGGSGCGVIGVNGWVNGGCKKNPEEWKQLKEEARLIAAAPELLEALRWYVETDEVSDMEGNEFWLAGKARAIAAIAKATGENQ